MIDFKLKDVETYQDIDILNGEDKIGKATIFIEQNQLSNFEIYTPYQNKGYGQIALKQLIETYGIKQLYVDMSNERALHIYKKFNFDFECNKGCRMMTIQVAVKEGK